MPQTPSASSESTTRCGEPEPEPRRPTSGNSLNGILRQHAGTSLFVRPASWTDLHSELLGARFVQLPPPCDARLPQSLPGSPPSSAGHPPGSKATATLKRALDSLPSAGRTSVFLVLVEIRKALSALWPAVSTPKLPLFYGDRVYWGVVRPRMLWNFPADSPPCTPTTSARSSSTQALSSNEDEASPSSSPSPPPHKPAGLPMMCYIGKQHLVSMRQKMFRVSARNPPVHRLMQLRRKALIPANPDHDAFLVAIFLAMAQRHFYRNPVPSKRRDSQWSRSGGSPRRPPFEDLRLRILTHDDDTAEFTVYTGYVTAGFLDRFFDPAKTPPGQEQHPSGLRIEYSRVPIWPVLGLRERLNEALGEEIVGPLDASAMQARETVQAGDVAQQHAEPKHDALPKTVVKNNFQEEETDSEEQPQRSLRAKRRRLSDGSPLEVVV
ncbi:hypothetical protein E4U41_007792 [Claviceps citrina]|nr:hypothetical protein E4U41_007792 [Claviceps citrina]